MLKALELVGFKSFADKTRFEFEPGITVVVGPNGSGKSNVVDAIKWVLGEQSVKSLRGTEMADVIFNGSATRRPLNSAETTLVFDNSDNRLPLDSAEVHVTRRVYRSGEAEYLINRQPCRLRDIRELFAGTGAATEAYSVIEQGKVDVLLQSSPRDRRIIFEEAAGISRFKAKKVEALRRLERVEQNLLRLSDIVDEVESRLRSVRQQAAKARRYQELAARLRSLRVALGLADWRRLTEQLDDAERRLWEKQGEIAAGIAQAEAIEARALEIETHIAQNDEQIRLCESRVSENRQELATLEAAIEHDRVFCGDLEAQAARHRAQLASHNLRAGDVDQQYQLAAQAAADAEDARRQASERLGEHERALATVNAQLDELREENHRYRTALLEDTKAAAALANEIGALEAQLAALDQARTTSQRQLAELAEQGRSLTEQFSRQESEQQRLTAELDSRSAAQQRAQGELVEARRALHERQTQLAALREQRTATAERSRLLAELEQRQEGVGAGVREVLALAKAEAPGPLTAVRGILADLLQVDEAMAPLIELALGDRAQYVVLTPGQNAAEFVQFLLSRSAKLSSRVGFFASETLTGTTRASSAPPSETTTPQGLAARADLGPADQFVQTAPEHLPLVQRLLGSVRIVRTLSDALRLAPSAAPGTQFITLGGEVLHPDRSLSLGPPQSSLGLISRRSELRSLATKIAQQDIEIQSLDDQTSAAQRQVAEQDRELGELTTARQQVAEQLVEARAQFGAVRDRLAQHEKQQAGVQQSLSAAEEKCAEVTTALATARETIAQRHQALEEIERQIRESSERIAALEESRDLRSGETTSAKVELARRDQQLDHLHAQLRQFEQARHERRQAIVDGRQQLADALARIRESEDRILSAESRLAGLYLVKQSLGAATIDRINEREDLRAAKNAAAAQASDIRSALRKHEEESRRHELAAGQLRHERAAVADRIREDYDIDLATIAAAPGDPVEPSSEDHSETAAPLPVDRTAADEEIADLRRKLANIGSVNLDALAEADELEARFTSLNNQFQDLSKAKSSLQQIVGKINADSRRLFAETLEVVRGHFQELFRKLFGGGQADIVLDKDADILDTGIEIVARPPGKEPRNISLLSGGEKTLTCVALLLAIFRSRPSPFCVLDEVDAALDEANTERFVAVLTEFLAWTRFIVVTHSKKTMTAANTLYGVTMQESGVSKRVSVRFEDVSENGEIRQLPSSDGPLSRAA